MEVAEAVAAVIEAGGEVGDGPLSLEDISALVEESVATEVAAQEEAAYAESLRAGFADEEVSRRVEERVSYELEEQNITLTEFFTE